MTSRSGRLSRYAIVLAATLSLLPTTTTAEIQVVMDSPPVSGGVMSADATESTVFAHPGLLTSRTQLDLVKKELAARAQPWTQAYDTARNSTFGSLSYQPKPRADVDCGPFQKPDLGCTQEWQDAQAAYTQALLWYYSGDRGYAAKSMQILNAWSAVLREHTNSNAPLQAGWMATVFSDAAEIIRYSGAGWSSSDIDRFENMLRTAFLPLIRNGASSNNGNWDLAMIEGSMSIAVFTNDHSEFNRQLGRWRARVPAYFYLTSDGPLPVPPPRTDITTAAELIKYWQHQSTFVNGLAQETCRDFAHTLSGLSEAIGAAEIAWNQHVDLYGEQAKRLTAAMEFHASYVLGKKPPAWLCGGHLNLGETTPTWEIAYRHYYQIMGIALPNTHAVITKERPMGIARNMVWETLTDGT